MPTAPKDPSRYETADAYQLRVTVLAPVYRDRPSKHPRTRNRVHRAINEGFGQYLTLCGLEYRHREAAALDTGVDATCGHCARVVAGKHRSSGIDDKDTEETR